MVLNDAGAIGLSLNAKSFPGTAPVIAKVGEWVEITYFNEGMQMHPMHLHGLPQLVIGKDGFPLPQPYSTDTLVIAPGERYTVLVHPTAEFLGAKGQPGVWAFHCHILSHAESDKGMFGMVTTLIVQ
jgi:FtsP/CotA-like multicopper oxidase with cupredoxin domain